MYPNDVTKTNLTVSVNLNPNPPVFDPSKYSKTITEDYKLGISLEQLTASDDENVI